MNGCWNCGAELEILNDHLACPECGAIWMSKRLKEDMGNCSEFNETTKPEGAVE